MALLLSPLCLWLFRVTFGLNPARFERGDPKQQYASAECIECCALADYDMGQLTQLT